MVHPPPIYPHTQRRYFHHGRESGYIHLNNAVKEEGANLSLGGQRQLMALARALVRNSRIIGCDEATSSLNMETNVQTQ